MLKYFREPATAQKPHLTPPVPLPSFPTGSTPESSRPSSSSGQPGNREVVKHEVMLHYLYQQQANSGWRAERDSPSEGVILRITRNNYLTCPAVLSESSLLDAIRALNLQCAMTVYSPVVRSFLEATPDALDIPLMNGMRLQIVETIEELVHARTHQFAACIASEALLLVWDDDALNLLTRAKQIEWDLMQIIWTSDYTYTSARNSRAGSKHEMQNSDDSAPSESDLEKSVPQNRPTIFINTVLVSISMCAMLTTLGLGLQTLVIECVTEIGFSPNPYMRFLLLLLTPLWMFFGIFFFNVLVTAVAECFGPIHQMTINSKHYSAKCSPRLTSDLPHVTIQCPVYKEGLSAVIAPTITSIKKAISTYELQGGTANIFINDDGLQLLDEDTRQARVDFYTDHGIGWVARPGHNQNGYLRKGKFKKASNMNFGLAISCSVEDKLKSIFRPSDWTQANETEAYEVALKDTLAEGGNIGWAEGNIRIGDFILIIDSDTQVPADCLLDAVSEMVPCPEVAILQFSSGVMQVVHNYFENGITFFTNLIYSAIRYGVANGDVAPFVGHNAILRWSAVQEVAFSDEEGAMKFWSESHVSEDFDIALRLQIAGYITRLAAWAGDGFKEGVSLSVYDELARWQKYAYGCNELMFNPIRTWLWRGPFTKLFLRFCGSNIPLASKINIISYIGTYYAIAAAWIMTVVNYFVIGWYKGFIDAYYLNSWEIWLTVLIAFNGLGNIALATIRYRIGERSILGALAENYKWLPLCFIFLGGISIHVSQAILAHMFEINMTWGATAKELEFSNFFVEVPKVLRKFWFTIIFCLSLVVLMIIMGVAPFIPYSWDINQLEAVVPMCAMIFCHMLLPIALNPALMTFAW